MRTDNELSRRTKVLVVGALAVVSWFVFATACLGIVYCLALMFENAARGAELDSGAKAAMEIFDENVTVCVTNKDAVSCRRAVAAGQSLVDHGYCLASISDVASNNAVPFALTFWHEGPAQYGMVICK